MDDILAQVARLSSHSLPHLPWAASLRQQQTSRVRFATAALERLGAMLARKRSGNAGKPNSRSWSKPSLGRMPWTPTPASPQPTNADDVPREALLRLASAGECGPLCGIAATFPCRNACSFDALFEASHSSRNCFTAMAGEDVVAALQERAEMSCHFPFNSSERACPAIARQ